MEVKTRVMTTQNGKVRGYEEAGLFYFKGIPYGASCDGRYRFLPPRPAERWEGEYDCTRNGAYAVQPACGVCASPRYGHYFSAGNPKRFGCDEEKQDENCLVLNIVTPTLGATRLPVLVYIHGGGYAAGNGSIILGADTFVKEQGIVAVSINHRLGVFGYLNLEEYDEKYQSSSMAGIYDLKLALEWIRDNIAGFGGDPSNITLMGESGGASKIRHLLEMKGTEDLFDKAILESGTYGIEKDPTRSRKITKGIFSSLGIQTVQELLEKPASEIEEAARPYLFQISPVADDLSIIRKAAGKFGSANAVRQKKILIGFSEDEANIDWKKETVTAENLPLLLSSPQTRPPMALSQKTYTREEAEGILQRYVKCMGHFSDEELYWKVSSLMGIGVQTASFIAERMHFAAESTYVYYNRYKAPFWGDETIKFSWHTSDLPLQFRIVPFEEGEQISAQLGQYWGSFVRNGKPEGAMEWPEYTLEDARVMFFDRQLSVRNFSMESYMLIMGV